MHFDLHRPCENCPFRHDITFPLRPERTEEILRAILQEDRTFICHKTVAYDNVEEQEDGTEAYEPSGEEQHCAGALLLLERTGLPNAMIQIAERLGLYDPRRLRRDAPVFATPQAMLERMRFLATGIQDKHCVESALSPRSPQTTAPHTTSPG